MLASAHYSNNSNSANNKIPQMLVINTINVNDDNNMNDWGTGTAITIKRSLEVANWDDLASKPRWLALIKITPLYIGLQIHFSQ